MEAGLPARLQSFRYSHNNSYANVCSPLLLNHAWPQLRSLSCGYNGLDGFLDAVLARPAAVFPHLESLDTGTLYGNQARKLLTLLERGVFPALVSLCRSGGPL